MLVGGKGSLAEYLFDIIRIDLDLHSLALSSNDDMESAIANAVTHHVPVAIDGIKSNQKLLSKWLEGQGSNSLVLAPPLTAAALGNEKDWYFVRAIS